MDLFSRLVLIITVLHLFFRHGVSSTALKVFNGEHEECTSLEDLRQQGSCELVDHISQGLTCEGTPVLECHGSLHVVAGTVCVHDGTGHFFTCSDGQWHMDGLLPGKRRVKRFLLGVFLGIVGCVLFCPSGGSSGGSSEYVENKPPSFTSCPSVPPHTADSGSLTKRVNWTAPTADDLDGEKPSITLVGGLVSGSEFPEGTTTMLYRARDSRGGTDFCTITVTVTVVTCWSGYQPLEHGDQTCSGRRHNILGSVCSHRCDLGYQLDGSSSVTCQSNGQWSSSFPSCQPVSCGTPGTVEGGDLDCNGDLTYRSFCSIQCHPGFSHSGGILIQCQANQTWTTPDPCKDSQPPEFPDGCPPSRQLYSGPLQAPINVTWDDPQVKDNSLQSVTLSSDPPKGSLLGVGFHVIKISAEDSVGHTTRCNFFVSVQERRCLPIMAPPNSHVTCTMGYIEGSECTVTCNQGYELQGAATMQCVESGQWNPSTPACQIISCPNLPSVGHGSFQCSSLQYRSVCFLTCDQGFKVQGSLITECLADATWSSHGNCTDVEAPQFLDTPCHDNVEDYAARLGQPTSVTFTPPPVTDNAEGQITLTSDLASGSSFPPGVTRVTYTATDVQGNSGTCPFTVTVTSLTCETPDLEVPNRTRTLMLYACPDGYVHGATCTLSCSHGFPLVGASNITCERDDATHPPSMEWVWPDPHLTTSECRENDCPDLDSPQNGALACHLGNYGWDCLMSCNEEWDVPAYTDGKFVCTNSAGYWVPAAVPHCLVRVRPGQVRMHSDVFYFSGSCNDSLDALKQSFISRISNSTWKDACVGVPSCVWQNVEVHCGPSGGRRKRDTSLGIDLHHRFTGVAHRLQREKRQTEHVTIDFEIIIEYEDGNRTKKEAYENYNSIILDMYSHLQADADAGHFNIEGMTANRYAVGYPLVSADCPLGTLFKATATTTSFSCVGCYRGRYLPPSGSQCLECPRGHYTEEDQATSCTPCPPGWTTPSPASTHSSQCKEMCSAGSISPDGFVPCQACPPGSYQGQQGATHCLHCPAGTWTASSNATGLHHCLDADVHLSPNRSVSAEVADQWDSPSLSARLWVAMSVNSSCLVSLQVGSAPSTVSLSLALHTGGADVASLPGSPVVSLAVESDSWVNVLFNLDPQDAAADTRVYQQGSEVHSTSLGLTANQPVTLKVTTDTGDVLVSGLRGDGKSLSQVEITDALTKCMGEKSSNLMTWVPSPISIFLPSTCDAVDECQQSPCSSQGQCENFPGGYQCVCEEGWGGNDCLVPPDVCDLNPCQNEAPCQPAASGAGHSNFTCLCDLHHSGTLCELEKVHGGYSSWSGWTECSATCEGTQQRQRLCDNPAPQNDGNNCTGQGSQTQSCGEGLCPRDGGFSLWSSFGPCNATCGGGERTRQRQCDNPVPQNNGSPCVGQSTEREACNTQQCPVDGGWGSWSSWGQCSATCGVGNQARQRLCDNPVPSGGQHCGDQAIDTRACNLKQCPECAALTRPYGGILTCEEEISPSYLKTCQLACRPGLVAAFSFPNYTCGEETGYLWNNQRDHDSDFLQLPACSNPNTLTGVVIQRTSQHNALCDEVSEAAVEQGLQDKLDTSLPCLPHCAGKVSTHCSPEESKGRRRRSADPLTSVIEVIINLGTSQVLDTGDPSAMAAYEQLLSMAQQTFLMMTERDSASLFSVTVNGKTVVSTNVSHDVYTTCPSGYTSLGDICAQCPVGSKEEGGRCMMCPLGQYQDQPASTSCKDCPPGLAWDVLGAAHITQCIF